MFFRRLEDTGSVADLKSMKMCSGRCAEEAVGATAGVGAVLVGAVLPDVGSQDG